MDTSARPDIVIVSASEIILIELTVPYNSPDCLHNTRSRKESKEIYQHALSDLETKELSVVDYRNWTETRIPSYCDHKGNSPSFSKSMQLYVEIISTVIANCNNRNYCRQTQHTHVKCCLYYQHTFVTTPI